MNRIVYRGLTGYRQVPSENATLIRNADEQNVDALTEILRRVSTAPSDDPQRNRLRRFPPAITGALARGTGLHPKLWARFRGGSCALTSPAKYGIESVVVKSCWPVQFTFGNVSERPR